ncbi:uncharacterized protein LOC142333544 isoform X2 [Lycorma delicatula]
MDIITRKGNSDISIEKKLDNVMSKCERCERYINSYTDGDVCLKHICNDNLLKNEENAKDDHNENEDKCCSLWLDILENYFLNGNNYNNNNLDLKISNCYNCDKLFLKEDTILLHYNNSEFVFSCIDCKTLVCEEKDDDDVDKSSAEVEMEVSGSKPHSVSDSCNIYGTADDDGRRDINSQLSNRLEPSCITVDDTENDNEITETQIGDLVSEVSDYDDGEDDNINSQVSSCRESSCITTGDYESVNEITETKICDLKSEISTTEVLLPEPNFEQIVNCSETQERSSTTTSSDTIVQDNEPLQLHSTELQGQVPNLEKEISNLELQISSPISLVCCSMLEVDNVEPLTSNSALLITQKSSLGQSSTVMEIDDGSINLMDTPDSGIQKTNEEVDVHNLEPQTCRSELQLFNSEKPLSNVMAQVQNSLSKKLPTEPSCLNILSNGLQMLSSEKQENHKQTSILECQMSRSEPQLSSSKPQISNLPTTCSEGPEICKAHISNLELLASTSLGFHILDIQSSSSQFQKPPTETPSSETQMNNLELQTPILDTRTPNITIQSITTEFGGNGQLQISKSKLPFNIDQSCITTEFNKEVQMSNSNELCLCSKTSLSKSKKCNSKLSYNTLEDNENIRLQMPRMDVSKPDTEIKKSCLHTKNNSTPNSQKCNLELSYIIDNDNENVSRLKISKPDMEKFNSKVISSITQECNIESEKLNLELSNEAEGDFELMLSSEMQKSNSEPCKFDLDQSCITVQDNRLQNPCKNLASSLEPFCTIENEEELSMTSSKIWNNSKKLISELELYGIITNADISALQKCSLVVDKVDPCTKKSTLISKKLCLESEKSCSVSQKSISSLVLEQPVTETEKSTLAVSNSNVKDGQKSGLQMTSSDVQKPGLGIQKNSKKSNLGLRKACKKLKKHSSESQKSHLELSNINVKDKDNCQLQTPSLNLQELNSSLKKANYEPRKNGIEQSSSSIIKEKSEGLEIQKTNLEFSNMITENENRMQINTLEKQKSSLKSSVSVEHDEKSQTHISDMQKNMKKPDFESHKASLELSNISSKKENNSDLVISSSKNYKLLKDQSKRSEKRDCESQKQGLEPSSIIDDEIQMPSLNEEITIINKNNYKLLFDNSEIQKSSEIAKRNVSRLQKSNLEPCVIENVDNVALEISDLKEPCNNLVKSSNESKKPGCDIPCISIDDDDDDDVVIVNQIQVSSSNVQPYFITITDSDEENDCTVINKDNNSLGKNSDKINSGISRNTLPDQSCITIKDNRLHDSGKNLMSSLEPSFTIEDEEELPMTSSKIWNNSKKPISESQKYSLELSGIIKNADNSAVQTCSLDVDKVGPCTEKSTLMSEKPCSMSQKSISEAQNSALEEHCVTKDDDEGLEMHEPFIEPKKLSFVLHKSNLEPSNLGNKGGLQTLTTNSEKYITDTKKPSSSSKKQSLELSCVNEKGLQISSLVLDKPVIETEKSTLAVSNTSVKDGEKSGLQMVSSDVQKPELEVQKNSKKSNFGLRKACKKLKKSHLELSNINVKDKDNCQLQTPSLDLQELNSSLKKASYEPQKNDIEQALEPSSIISDDIQLPSFDEENTITDKNNYELLFGNSEIHKASENTNRTVSKLQKSNLEPCVTQNEANVALEISDIKEPSNNLVKSSNEPKKPSCDIPCISIDDDDVVIVNQLEVSSLDVQSSFVTIIDSDEENDSTVINKDNNSSGKNNDKINTMPITPSASTSDLNVNVKKSSQELNKSEQLNVINNINKDVTKELRIQLKKINVNNLVKTIVSEINPKKLRKEILLSSKNENEVNSLKSNENSNNNNMKLYQKIFSNNVNPVKQIDSNRKLNELQNPKPSCSSDKNKNVDFSHSKNNNDTSNIKKNKKSVNDINLTGNNDYSKVKKQKLDSSSSSSSCRSSSDTDSDWDSSTESSSDTDSNIRRTYKMKNDV